MVLLANPKIGEREVLATLLDHNHHLLRDGQILLADKGFAGGRAPGGLHDVDAAAAGAGDGFLGGAEPGVQFEVVGVGQAVAGVDPVQQGFGVMLGDPGAVLLGELVVHPGERPRSGQRDQEWEAQ